MYTGRRRTTRRRIVFPVVLAVALIGVGVFFCIRLFASLPKFRYGAGDVGVDTVDYPDVRFAVIGDPHTYDGKSLGTEGSAFNNALASERKFLIESLQFLDAAVEEILASGVSFVLIPGDLTKDGERVNHDLVGLRLRLLTEAGIRVYVVPGDHDVNNPHALRYDGDLTEPVPSVTAQEFAELYNDFGYSEAISRDESTLSYLVEPIDGLYLLALDANRWAGNSSGTALSQATVDWVDGVCRAAHDAGKALVVLSHHGVVEHWRGQSRFRGDDLIDDYVHFGNMLASYGVRLVFTGHGHAQDITRGNYADGSFLFDIETGSLVAPPCPIRYVSFADGTVVIDTVTRIGGDLSEHKYGLSIDSEAIEAGVRLIRDSVEREVFDTLKGYFLPDADAKYIADAVGVAFGAHCMGDEASSRRESVDTGQLSLWGRIVFATQRYILDGLWNDLAPQDNAVILDLK